MKESYYIFDTTSSGKLGPYSISQLREMYRAGTINAKTFVCLDGSSAWQEVSVIEHKFTAPIANPPQSQSGGYSNSPGRDDPAKKIQPGQCCLQFVLLILAIGFLGWLFFHDTYEPTPSTASAATSPSPQVPVSTPAVVSPDNNQAAATAEKKEDEERQNRQQQEQANSQKDAATFKQLLVSVEADSTIVSSVSVGSGMESDQITIVVADAWHSQPYQDRLQLAQAFLKLWISIHSPGHPNESRISITDLMGNEVGGSSMWSGAWVIKDE